MIQVPCTVSQSLCSICMEIFYFLSRFAEMRLRKINTTACLALSKGNKIQAYQHL